MTVWRAAALASPSFAVSLAAPSFAALSLGSALGCAEVLDIPEKPTLVLSALPPWSCVDQGSQRALPAAPSAFVQVLACDFSDDCMSIVSNIKARVCSRDGGCAEDAVVVADTDGLIEVEVPLDVDRGFDGYLDITSFTQPCSSEGSGTTGPLSCALPGCDTTLSDADCEVPVDVHALYYFNPPIVADTPLPLLLPLLRAANMSSLAEAAGATFNPAAGNLFVTAEDCSGRPAAGVAYELLPAGDQLQPLYMLDDGRFSTEMYSTDGSGLGGFLGVPPGQVTVTGYVGERWVGAIDVSVAPYTLTYSGLTPF